MKRPVSGKTMLLAALLVAMSCTSPPVEGRDALWKIVHGQCVPNQTAHGDAAPCQQVDLAGGYAVLKDKRGTTQFLVIPTDKISGIEDPALLSGSTPNFFADAWTARGDVEAALHRSLRRQDIALAVNSVTGRSQDQLHIHVDCLKPEVRDVLLAHAGALAASWTPFPVPLAGHNYQARRVRGETLQGVAPFILLADGLPGARAAMGDYTLAVAGASFADGTPGFVLLADRADAATGDRASAAELLDHGCAVAK